jgi:C-terminal processing protease CtpA/Prc
MHRLLIASVLWTALAVPGQGQDTTAGPELGAILSFEVEHAGAIPTGWGGGPPGTISVDGDVVHGGRWSVRLERTETSAQAFTTLTNVIPVDFAGTTIEWRGFLRSEDVSEFMALWMRQDGDAPGLAFATMQPQQIRGTNDWMEYSIALPVHAEARALFFGVLLAGTGRVWVDDLRLLVDGRPVWEAPKVERLRSPIELDREFDDGSGIAISELTPVEVQNLTMLGKVWGFLKYHHPAVTSGTRHWDYELFRVMPPVLAARDRDAASAVVRDWVQRLGAPAPCDPCIALPQDDLHFGPDLDWIDDRAVVGRDLAGLLRTIHQSRSRGRQFYVSQVPNVGNPQFTQERPYAGLAFPDAGYQLLSLYRFWNIIEYWFPYRDLIDEDWDRVLIEFVPRIALAPDKDAYQLEMLALIGRVHDTHANLWSMPPQLRPPTGDCQLPVNVRFVEDRPVVTGYLHADSGPATGLQVGDVIEGLDGVPVEDLVVQWEPYYPASNQATRLRDIARAMTRGPCGTVRVGIRRLGTGVAVSAQRQPLASLDLQTRLTHDRPGDAFQRLSDQVAYLKLSSVEAAQAASYVTRARDTRGLIIDIRNYPSDFVVFALGSLLVNTPAPFVRFTAADLDNPGAFLWRGDPLVLAPQPPHYAGRVVILVDETTLSQAEYTAMAFRAAPDAVVVGSTTAGADGNVSQIPLPGGLSTLISGIGVFYPDKRPTQRVGIVPDVEVRPTIAGIRDGRDEVLEEGLRQILGRSVPEARIREMAGVRP